MYFHNPPTNTHCPAHLQPRALNYDGSASPAPSRLQREASLQLQRTPSGARSARPGSVAGTARTPAPPSRFSQPPPGTGHDSTAAATAADPDGNAFSSDNIRVVLRVRPRNERESMGGGGVCVQPLSAAAVRVASHPDPHTFSFDYVAGDATTQETIFRGAAVCLLLAVAWGMHLGAVSSCPVLRSAALPSPHSTPLPRGHAVAGKPIVDNCLGGYNGCIFAYGQTGSGALQLVHPLGRLLALEAAFAAGAALSGPFSTADCMPSPCLLSAAAAACGAGKTYTMLGSDETAGEWSGAPGRDEARGLIQRVFEHLFARMAEAGGKHLLECYFLEIYNEVGGWMGGDWWGRVRLVLGGGRRPGWLVTFGLHWPCEAGAQVAGLFALAACSVCCLCIFSRRAGCCGVAARSQRQPCC